MSVISIAVKHLMMAGVTCDAIVTAIAEMELCKESRSKAAIRQERYRNNKASQNVTNVTSDDLPSQGSFSPTPPLTPNSPIKENPPKGGQKKVSQEIPAWMPKAEWEGFIEMRKKIKKPMTPHAEQLAIGKLEKFMAMGHDPTEILNQSIMNDYQDLYEPKQNQSKSYANEPRKSKFDIIAAGVAQARAEREQAGSG